MIPEGSGGQEDESQDRRQHSREQGDREVQLDRYSLMDVEGGRPLRGEYRAPSKLTPVEVIPIQDQYRRDRQSRWKVREVGSHEKEQRHPSGSGSKDGELRSGKLGRGHHAPTR